MRENPKLIDDLMALGGNILGNILGARHEVGAQARQRMETLAQRLDLVSRNEFDVAFAMLAKARAMQEELHERLAAIESRIGRSPARAGSQKHTSRTRKSKNAPKQHLPSVKEGTRRKKRP